MTNKQNPQTILRSMNFIYQCVNFATFENGKFHCSSNSTNIYSLPIDNWILYLGVELWWRERKEGKKSHRNPAIHEITRLVCAVFVILMPIHLLPHGISVYVPTAESNFRIVFHWPLAFFPEQIRYGNQVERYSFGFGVGLVCRTVTLSKPDTDNIFVWEVLGWKVLALGNL